MNQFRIQARKGGKVAHEARESDQLTAVMGFQVLAEANAEANKAGQGYDNIELQVKDAGAARFRPLLQAVGTSIITWGSL